MIEAALVVFAAYILLHAGVTVIALLGAVCEVAEAVWWDLRKRFRPRRGHRVRF